MAILSARAKAIKEQKEAGVEEDSILPRLVCYGSRQAHSSVEKAGLIGLVKLRYIESDDNLALRGDKLKEAIKRDREAGLIPFYVRTAEEDVRD